MNKFLGWLRMWPLGHIRIGRLTPYTYIWFGVNDRITEKYEGEYLRIGFDKTLRAFLNENL